MDYLSFLEKLYQEIIARYNLLSDLSTVKCDGSLIRLDSTKLGDQVIWVCVHSWEYKGNVYYQAIFGNWRQGDKNVISSYAKGQTFSRDFFQKQKDVQKEAQDKLDQVKKQKQELCRTKWTPYFHLLPTNEPTHEYLLAKGINSNFHARVNEKNILHVPAWNSNGVFVGVQRIFKDPESGKFEKIFSTGIEILGSFCPFGDVRNAEFVYIAEGFATAASVYMAFNGNPKVAVVCAWNTSNLLEGANAVRRINPSSYLIFAADRDINKDPKLHNIGEKKAKMAANKLSNALVKTVQFSVQNDSWSDFNDLHQYEGLDKVAKQLSADISDFVEIIPLGYNQNNYYYFSTSRKQILEFSKSDHNKQSFLLQAPQKYWGDRFGYIMRQDGTLTNSPDFTKVVEGLGTQITKAGPFNFAKVRGVGAWEHDGDIMVNMGDKLYYQNQFYPLFNHGIESEYFYEASSMEKLDFDRPLSNSDCLKFVEAFQLLRYKNPSDAIIVLGWLFSAQIFAALPWRPHIWFTGERGSGKSTILNYIHDCVKFSMITQDSTVSGIRQKIVNNAQVIITDEAEPNTEKDRERLQELLTLARQCSTRSSYEVLRGTATGKSLSYNTNANFCMGSIQIAKMGGADTSRFFVIEMDTIEGQSHEQFIRLENAMNELKFLSDGLFVRAVKVYTNLIKNIEFAKSVIKNKKIESRQADQIAPIIAGYYAFFDTGIMPESFITETLRNLNFEQSNYVKANEESDSEQCLNHILGIQIPGRSITIGQCLEQFFYASNQTMKDEQEMLLGLFAIKFDPIKGELFIPSSSGILKNQMEKISSYSDYANILRRHKKFAYNGNVRVSGSVKKGIYLNYSPAP